MKMFERGLVWSKVTLLVFAGLGCEPAEPVGGEVLYRSEPFTDLSGVKSATGGVSSSGGVLLTGGSILSSGGGLITGGTAVATSGGSIGMGGSETGGLNGTGGTVSTGGQFVGGAEGSGGMVASLELSSMTFQVATEGQGGKYSPKNIGAIWLEDAQGNWVRTLEKWAARRERHLHMYTEAGPDFFTDAITSATLTRHTAHSLTWDLNDSAGARVTGSDFTVWIEVTEKDGQGDYISVPFSLSAGPGLTTIADEASFSGMSIELN